MIAFYVALITVALVWSFPFEFLLGVPLLMPRQSKTIIDTMAPVLAKTFGTLDDTGLCSSVEILAVSASILFFGKVNEIFPSKWVLLSVLLLFLVGETICGKASSAPTFIAGRAVTEPRACRSIRDYHDNNRGRLSSAPTTVHRGESGGSIHNRNFIGAPFRWDHHLPGSHFDGVSILSSSSVLR